VEVTRLVARALVEKLAGDEDLAIVEDVLGSGDSTDSTEEVAPEKLTTLDVACGSPTCVACAVSLEAAVDWELPSTPIVVYPATEPEKVGEAVT
jgi:hypothetical protein